MPNLPPPPIVISLPATSEGSFLTAANAIAGVWIETGSSPKAVWLDKALKTLSVAAFMAATTAFAWNEEDNNALLALMKKRVCGLKASV